MASTEATPWDDILDEHIQADDLHRALTTLESYYDQSKGKKAQALKARLLAAYLPKYNIGPRHLAPFDKAAQAAETPASIKQRRRYWVEILRPLLADPAFVSSINTVIVNNRTRDLDYSREMHDQAVAIIENAVPYWDAYFSVLPS